MKAPNISWFEQALENFFNYEEEKIQKIEIGLKRQAMRGKKYKRIKLDCKRHHRKVFFERQTIKKKTYRRMIHRLMRRARVRFFKKQAVLFRRWFKDTIAVEKIENLQTRQLVFFDLETGGLGITADILQIAAKCKEKVFSVYALPTRAISKKASEATLLAMEENRLYFKGEEVPAVPLSEALSKLLIFLECFDHPILVGHNIQTFDVPILRHHLGENGLLKRFSNDITGFLDTLKVSKKYLIDPRLRNYKQQTLVETLIGETYEAHNAKADVTALEKLYYAMLDLSEKELYENIFYSFYYTCKKSLEPLLEGKAISQMTYRKLARNGLNLSRLRKIHAKDRLNGIRYVFSETVEGTLKTRITKSFKVIQGIANYIDMLDGKCMLT